MKLLVPAKRVVDYDITIRSGPVLFRRRSAPKSDRPIFTSTKVTISGGRTMQKAENFKTYVEPVVSKLGATMCAHWPVVDAG